LGREHAQHSSSDCEAGALTGIARDLSELDACEVNFLPRQVRSVFRHVAEELPDSAIGPGCARHLPALTPERFADQIAGTQRYEK
jgi:hypothetical protein